MSCDGNENRRVCLRFGLGRFGFFWSSKSCVTRPRWNQLMYTDRLWTTALQQLHSVPSRCWWRADEHLYVVIDMLVQRLTSPGDDWPLCSNRSLTECTWSQLDTLHSGHLRLCTVALSYRQLHHPVTQIEGRYLTFLRWMGDGKFTPLTELIPLHR